MSKIPLTRRNFMRNGAAIAALSLATEPADSKAQTLADDSGAGAPAAAGGFGTALEMATARAWGQSFRLPIANSAKSASTLLPEALHPPFSFIYGDRAASELLASWTCEVKDTDLDNTKQQRDVTYTDRASGLVLRCTAIIFKDFPAVEWVLHFKNSGSADTPTLKDIQALDTALLSPDADPTIHYSRGGSNSMDDFMPMTRVLGARGQLNLQPGGGRSSSLFMPFFNIETKGEGAIMAIGWTGEWAAAFEHANAGPDFRVKAGMALTHFKLNPGEEVRTPKILMLFWQGARVRGNNLLRQFILTHHRPLVDGKPLLAPITNPNWGGTPASDHLENIRQIIAHKLPFEYYWIDAEWFGHGLWWKNPGNWNIKKDLYPQGFKPITDLLHSSGHKFLLWFEPERVCEGTPWYTEHAEWLLSVPADKEVYRGFEGKDAWDIPRSDPAWIPNESGRNQFRKNDRLFNLADPQARRYFIDFFSNKVDEFAIDCFRNDSNIAPLEFWRAADAPDRQGITEIRWIEGLYEFWDELRRRHPNLMIDDCASGGRRIDLETLGRSIALSRTDFTGNTLADQCHSYGLLQWVPLNTMFTINLSVDNDYPIRSSMTGGISYGLFGAGEAPQPKIDYAKFPFAAVKKALEKYRTIQKYFYGDFYPLTEYTQNDDAWMAYQFDLPAQGEGLVVILKRPLSDYSQAAFPLKALEKNAIYEITNLDNAKKQINSATELTSKGLDVHLLKRPDSVVLRYKKMS
jgi:alpha-galactosidase